MEKDLLTLNQIKNDLNNAKNARELYQLLSSYNAFSILLLKAKYEYERKNTNLDSFYLDTNCYEDQISNLFSLFRIGEYLKGEHLSKFKTNDMLFLIDIDTLLRIKTSYALMSREDTSLLDYELLKINNCVGKVYNQREFCSDPYYCDSHYEEREAFGFFYNGKLVTSSYTLNSELSGYNSKDIREILTPQSLDEIYKKITAAKDEKVSKLSLIKK